MRACVWTRQLTHILPCTRKYRTSWNSFRQCRILSHSDLLPNLRIRFLWKESKSWIHHSGFWPFSDNDIKWAKLSHWVPLHISLSINFLTSTKAKVICPGAFLCALHPDFTEQIVSVVANNITNRLKTVSLRAIHRTIFHRLHWQNQIFSRKGLCFLCTFPLMKE